MKNRTLLSAFSFFIIFFPIANFAAAEEPLTLESSIDIALKNSVIIHSAKEGVQGATAQKRKLLPDFCRRLIHLTITPV
jgi:hypothetical protein